MSPEQLYKASWVNGELTMCLRMGDMHVHRARYRVDGAMEFVDIEYQPTDSRRWTRTVNVTGDSCKAILKDILKVL